MSVAVAKGPVRTPEAAKQPAETSYQYPGIPTTCDGAEAVVHVEVAISQAAGAYPITSSTTMGGGFNGAVMNGEKNLFGDTLMFFEPESEHSAAAVCEGFAVAGGRVTNFTSGPGSRADEGGALHDLRQAPAGGDEHRCAGAHQPGAQRPRGPRRRHERRRRRLGNALRAQRPGSRRLLPHLPPRRGSDQHAVLQRPGRVPHDPHRRDRAAARAGVHEGVRRRPEDEADEPDGSRQPDDVGRGPEPGLVHEGQDRPALVLRPRRAGTGRRVRGVRPQDRPACTATSRPIAARMPTTSWSAWVATWRPRRSRSITSARRRASRRGV